MVDVIDYQASGTFVLYRAGVGSSNVLAAPSLLVTMRLGHEFFKFSEAT